MDGISLLVTNLKNNLLPGVRIDIMTVIVLILGLLLFFTIVGIITGFLSSMKLGHRQVDLQDYAISAQVDFQNASNPDLPPWARDVARERYRQRVRILAKEDYDYGDFSEYAGSEYEPGDRWGKKTKYQHFNQKGKWKNWKQQEKA